MININDENESNPSSANVVNQPKDNGQLRIAWRYQDLPNDKFPDLSAKPNIFGNTFTMGKHFKTEDLKTVTINHYGLSSPGTTLCGGLTAYCIEQYLLLPALTV